MTGKFSNGFSQTHLPFVSFLCNSKGRKKDGATRRQIGFESIGEFARGGENNVEANCLLLSGFEGDRGREPRFL